MNQRILAIVSGLLPAALAGCISLGDTHEVYPPTLGRELSDLRMSLDRGALSPQEFEQRKNQLLAENPRRSRDFLASDHGDQMHSVDGRRAPLFPPQQQQYADQNFAPPNYPPQNMQNMNVQNMTYAPQMEQPQFIPQPPGQMPPNMQPPTQVLPPDGWH